MRLQFLGSGDAFGSGGRFNTCFHLERQAHGNVLIDCGASSMVAIRKWDVEPNGISTMQHYSGAPSYALRIETEGKVLTYSGDTEWVEELIPAAKNADLFICEAYFYDKVMKYHIDYKTLASHLPEIDPKRTIVTHMSPELLSRQGEIALEAASDGLVVDF
jgi:ribonuclease BN (tRNA processing enzyme)